MAGEAYQPGDTGYVVSKASVAAVVGDGVNGSNESLGRRLEEEALFIVFRRFSSFLVDFPMIFNDFHGFAWRQEVMDEEPSEPR